MSGHGLGDYDVVTSEVLDFRLPVNTHHIGRERLRGQSVTIQRERAGCVVNIYYSYIHASRSTFSVNYGFKSRSAGRGKFKSVIDHAACLNGQEKEKIWLN